MKRRVLIGDDESLARARLRTLLGDCTQPAADVHAEAANAVQAMTALQRDSFDVVLLDISMPGVNGLEAIPRIRALLRPPAILVLSMHDEAQMAARALKIGAAGYATKDSDPALLIAAIRMLRPAQIPTRRVRTLTQQLALIHTLASILIQV